MKQSIWALVFIPLVAAGCGRGQAQPPGRTTPPPPATGGAPGRWQVIAFNPSDDTDADGAILLDTATGQTWVLCDYATSWCKLDRQE